jgi:hypothetical protein
VVYTFGYHGWGTNTRRLAKLAAEWEEKAGRREPMWVDIRWSRSSRAPEFRDAGFSRATGPKHYLWMQGLGNSAIATKGFKIAHPPDAERLLDVILEAHESRRRVLFFCACELIRVEGRIRCHRAHVANLLLATARRRGRGLTVVASPGGDPESHTFEVDDRHLRGWDSWVMPRARVPQKAPLLVPQATAFVLRGRTEERVALMQTPVYASGWRYRLLWTPLRPMTEAALTRKQASVRKAFGLDEYTTA